MAVLYTIDTSDRQLWRIDPQTPANSVAVAVLPSTYNGIIQGMVEFEGGLLAIEDRGSSTNARLLVINPGTGGVTLVGSVSGLRDPRGLAVFNGNLLCIEDTGSGYGDLSIWVLNRSNLALSTEYTHSGFLPSGDDFVNLDPGCFMSLGGRLYFIANPAGTRGLYYVTGFSPGRFSPNHAYVLNSALEAQGMGSGGGYGWVVDRINRHLFRVTSFLPRLSARNQGQLPSACSQPRSLAYFEGGSGSGVSMTVRATLSQPTGGQVATGSAQAMTVRATLSQPTGGQVATGSAQAMTVRATLSQPTGGQDGIGSARSMSVRATLSQAGDALMLEDFDQNRLEVEVLALLRIVRVASRLYWPTDPQALLEGDFAFDPDSGPVPINAVYLVSVPGRPEVRPTLTVTVTDAEFALNSYFLRGAGSELTLWIQTNDGVASVSVADAYFLGHNRHIVFHNLPSAMLTLLNGLSVGRRVILAFTRVFQGGRARPLTARATLSQVLGVTYGSGRSMRVRTSLSRVRHLDLYGEAQSLTARAELSEARGDVPGRVRKRRFRILDED